MDVAANCRIPKELMMATSMGVAVARRHQEGTRAEGKAQREERGRSREIWAVAADVDDGKSNGKGKGKGRYE